MSIDTDSNSRQSGATTLQDIERILAEHEGVKEAVVVQQFVENTEQAVAYVVPDGGGVTAGHLRKYLEGVAPKHLLPTVFVVLEQLPLTPDGTLDRGALPLPSPLWTLVEESYAAPTTPVEQALAEIWSDVLMIDKVGIHDHFLELGGDSMIGTQVVAKIYERFGTEISLESLFDRGTIAGIIEDFLGEPTAGG